MSPPAKRARTALDDEMLDDQNCLRSSVFWLKDGNIVLQAEQTLFRVHGSVLARHSKVFRDMFEIPQPTSQEDFLVDGCPIVHLSDSALDIQEILNLFYDNLFTSKARKIPLPMLKAMLRLGRKYGIDYLFQEGIAAFRQDYPRSLSGWNPVEGIIIFGPGGGSDFYVNMIQLAHELSLWSVLPSLYLDYVTTFDLSDIAGQDQSAGCLLDAALRPVVLVGRDRLLRHLRQQQLLFYKQVMQNTPQIFCLNDAKCKTKRIEFYENLVLWGVDNDGRAYDLRMWEENEVQVQQVCSLCLKGIRSIVEKVREDTWQKLPSFFDLGDWQDLEDDASS